MEETEELRVSGSPSSATSSMAVRCRFEAEDAATVAAAGLLVAFHLVFVFERV
jgi:hypothetical protein